MSENDKKREVEEWDSLRKGWRVCKQRKPHWPPLAYKKCFSLAAFRQKEIKSLLRSHSTVRLISSHFIQSFYLERLKMIITSALSNNLC